MKKILFLLSNTTMGGAENVIFTIMSLLKGKYEFLYCSPKGSIQNVLEERKINYVTIDKMDKKSVAAVVKKYRPDVIHANDYRASCVATCFFNEAKIFSQIHGNYDYVKKLNLKSLYFLLCSMKMSKIIWVSKSSFDGYFFHKFLKKKSLILQNVIESKVVKNKAKEFVCSDDIDLIFLGRLAYPKNVERIIEIMKLLRKEKNDIRLAIVGDGIDKLKLINLVKEYNLEKNVKFYGFQSNPYPILNKSKFLIMTSFYEGTPMCALEAQSLGIPVISTPVDGLLNIVENDLNGCLCNTNGEFKIFILKYLFDKNKYKTLVESTKRNFYKINNEKGYSNTWMSLYNLK